jgi:hypothetical protein
MGRLQSTCLWLISVIVSLLRSITVRGGIYKNTPWRDWDFALEAVSEDKVRLAIDGFGTFKAVGEDGIFPGLLQHWIEIIIDHITNIFAAYLAYGYIPLAWKAVRVIFIPKPCCDSYELAKTCKQAHKPDIFLFENDGKTSGFLHNSWTVKILLAYGITVCIPERQIHWGCSSRSCSNDWGELDPKEFAMGVFLDIDMEHLKMELF